MNHCLFAVLILLLFAGVPAAMPAQVPHPLVFFTPPGMVLLDSAGGDLNGDKLRDLVVVYRSPKEDTGWLDLPRPAMILLGERNGGYRLFARNDKIIMCQACGGIFGDPFDDIVVKGRFFSFEFMGGSANRWEIVTTFRYDKKRRDFVLHKDGGIGYNVHEAEKVETDVYNRKQYGKLRFKDYGFKGTGAWSD
jgi:hypothetical protein